MTSGSTRSASAAAAAAEASSSGPSSGSSSRGDEGLTLTLKSPVGKEAMVYNWPLKKGKGSLRRSEDKQDEAAEILETIRYVCTVETDPVLHSFKRKERCFFTDSAATVWRRRGGRGGGKIGEDMR